MQATHTDTPAATVERFSELLGAGRLEELLQLYEDDAAFVAEPGRTVTGLASIRAELEPLVALAPRMSGSIEQVVEAGDTALVSYRWELEATAPDGTPIRRAGLSADVLRRRSDGTWGVMIDDPYGARAASATPAQPAR
jgi:uncharacterized protein (TIGR02246 family)